MPLHLAGATRELFAFLLNAKSRQVRRDMLLDLFWEDADIATARGAFNTAIWRINKLLKSLSGLAIASTAETVLLEAEPDVLIDAMNLEAAVRHLPRLSPDDGANLREADRDKLVHAVDDYAGPFLDGCDSDWALVEREKFFNLYLRASGSDARRRPAPRLRGSARVRTAILAADPFREQVQCEVMWLYVLSGQRVRALNQYRGYEALLARQLKIMPMAETRALFDYIRADMGGNPIPSDGQHERRPNNAAASREPIGRVTTAIERSRRAGYQTVQPRSA